MLWLYAAIISYFLFASASVADRYLLAGPLEHRRAAVFYGGITGVWVLVLIPFGFRFPPLETMALSFLAGVLSIGWLWALYNALKFGYASTVVPAIGAFASLFTFLFSFVFFGENIAITSQNALAFILMVFGSLLLSFRKDEHLSGILRIVLAACMLGLVFASTKAVFDREGFVNGLIWIQFSAFVAAFSMLLSKHTREVLFKKNPIKKKKVWGAILVQKTAGGGGSLLQKVAIWQASVAQLAFINALAGIQYFFVLLFAALLAIKHPKILKEKVTKKTLIIRAAGIAGISIGLALLFLN